MASAAAEAKAKLMHAAEEALGGEAVCRFFVPGRIEVLGKHTDYAGGRSLLCAAERGMCVAAAPANGDRLHVVDAVLPRRAEFSLDRGARVSDPRGHGSETRATQTGATQTGATQTSAAQFGRVLSGGGGWVNYLSTVLSRVNANFGSLGGARIAIASDLPRSSGMSSSSVLIVATFLALRELNRLREREAYRANIHSDEDLAAYLACIENGQSFRGLAGERGVGTFGGSEDHTAILCCRPGELALYRFCPASREASIPLPGEWVFAIGSSGVIADKIGSARDKYNRASHAAAAVLRVWREATGRNDSTLFAAATSSPQAQGNILRALSGPRLPKAGRPFDELRAGGGAPGLSEFSRSELMDRFDQFCRESLHIIPAAAEALRRGDLEIFGLQADESQSAAELLLRNQVPETVHLARSARELGAAAASAFGAGFGGAVWALIKTADAADFLRSWREAYISAFPARATQAQFFTTSAGPAVVQISS